MLYGACSRCRPLCCHQDLSKTWYALFTVLPLFPQTAHYHHNLIVTLGGAALFLCFGVIYIYSAYQMTDVEMHIPSG